MDQEKERRKEKRKAFWKGALISGSIVGTIALATDYVKCHVPEFIRMHGPKYIIHYLMGKDAYNEIYEKIGI